jgi:alkylated DNA repair dioxygenase AlkB
MNANLFDITKADRIVTSENASQINGLKIYFDFISKEEENELQKNIDSSQWLNELTRRVQHYGYKYDYKARRIDKSFFIGEIPKWMMFLADRLIEKGIINFKPDQAIINEYVNAQGIAAHIDCEPCFGDTIISISIIGQCVMNFQKNINTKEQDKIPLLIPPRTLVVMTEESRFKWYHGIPSRKTDKFNQQIHKRHRRISITFRKVILENKQ